LDLVFIHKRSLQAKKSILHIRSHFLGVAADELLPSLLLKAVDGRGGKA
jgi:hypothetical protein